MDGGLSPIRRAEAGCKPKSYLNLNRVNRIQDFLIQKP